MSTSHTPIRLSYAPFTIGRSHGLSDPSALGALMALSFAESSFFPIPPDVLLLPCA